MMEIFRFSRVRSLESPGASRGVVFPIFSGDKCLVGGFNPCEKYARQIGNLPQIGVKISKIFELPPPKCSCLKSVSTYHLENSFSEFFRGNLRISLSCRFPPLFCRTPAACFYGSMGPWIPKKNIERKF